MQSMKQWPNDDVTVLNVATKQTEDEQLNDIMDCENPAHPGCTDCLDAPKVRKALAHREGK